MDTTSKLKEILQARFQLEGFCDKETSRAWATNTVASSTTPLTLATCKELPIEAFRGFKPAATPKAVHAKLASTQSSGGPSGAAPSKEGNPGNVVTSPSKSGTKHHSIPDDIWQDYAKLDRSIQLLEVDKAQKKLVEGQHQMRLDLNDQTKEKKERVAKKNAQEMGTPKAIEMYQAEQDEKKASAKKIAQDRIAGRLKRTEGAAAYLAQEAQLSYSSGDGGSSEVPREDTVSLDDKQKVQIHRKAQQEYAEGLDAQVKARRATKEGASKQRDGDLAAVNEESRIFKAEQKSHEEEKKAKQQLYYKDLVHQQQLHELKKQQADQTEAELKMNQKRLQQLRGYVSNSSSGKA